MIYRCQLTLHGKGSVSQLIEARNEHEVFQHLLTMKKAGQWPASTTGRFIWLGLEDDLETYLASISDDELRDTHIQLRMAGHKTLL